MKLYKIAYVLFMLITLTSCSSVKKINNEEENDTYYLPSKILINNYRLIGNKDVLNVRRVNYGNFFHRINPPIVQADFKIKPSNKDWKEFWDSLNKLGIWQWKSRYYSPRTEGWKNKIVLIYPNKNIEVSIESKNPENYSQFIDAVDKLTKYKENSLTKKQFMEKLNKQKHNKLLKKERQKRASP